METEWGTEYDIEKVDGEKVVVLYHMSKEHALVLTRDDLVELIKIMDSK